MAGGTDLATAINQNNRYLLARGNDGRRANRKVEKSTCEWKRDKDIKT